MTEIINYHAPKTADTAAVGFFFNLPIKNAIKLEVVTTSQLGLCYLRLLASISNVYYDSNDCICAECTTCPVLQEQSQVLDALSSYRAKALT